MLKLYPPPKRIRARKATFQIGARRLIRVASKLDERARRAIERFASSAPISLATSNGQSSSNDAVFLTVSIEATLSQSYMLSCEPQGLALVAATEADLHYGLQTLLQILNQCGATLPCFSITDAADFEQRGIMLDISRCKVPDQTTLFNMIDDFAALKINQLQLYTEHTFAFEAHPLVWADASPLSAADIIAIKHYCADRYITLVPNLNSFGHFERWLRHPEYHHLAECPHGFEHPFSGQQMPFGSTLRPEQPSLELLQSLFDEYLPLFDAKFFNIGGDEPWELGKGVSRARCEKEGTTNVYVDFISKIKQQVKARGRKMMFWSDIVLREPESLTRLSRDFLALNWGYEADHPFRRECGQMAKAGIPFYVCPGTSSWNSLTGRTANVQKNLANAASAGLGSGATGYLITDWGDHGHHQYLPISYQGFLLGACHAWHHKGSKNLDVVDGLNRIYFKDASGNTGKLLVALGEVLALAPSPLRNATVFNRLLFWDMLDEPTVVKDITAQQLRACEKALVKLSVDLAGIRPARDAGLIRDELANAIRLAIHGVHRLQYFRGTIKDVSALRTELSIAIGEHERLWLARNRPGGLHESSDHLRRSLTVLH